MIMKDDGQDDIQDVIVLRNKNVTMINYCKALTLRGMLFDE